jgi:hypothetical protein
LTMLNPFDWLRRKAAEAVVLGTSDGLRAVAPDGETPPTDLTELRAMLAASIAPKQLAAAPDDDDPPAKRRK